MEIITAIIGKRKVETIFTKNNHSGWKYSAENGKKSIFLSIEIIYATKTNYVHTVIARDSL